MSTYRMTLSLMDSSGTGLLDVQWYQLDLTVDIAQALIDAGEALFGLLVASQVITGPASTGSGLVPVTSAARLLYSTHDGTRVPITVLAAQPSIYASDGETVNPSEALVAAVSAALIAHGCDSSGSAVVTYQSGTAVGLRRPGISH
jgi:hypothetical protein